MRLQLPFVTRRRHEAALAAEQAETLRVKKVKDGWWQRHDRVAEELAAVSIVNACLTEANTELREQLAELRAQLSDSAATYWSAEARREKRRADRLQKQYDDAVGLTGARPQDSSRWQPGYKEAGA
ncbi:hypothetical protein [Streptomyces sp. NPDC050121]|uniref:hypothetical protein n=1 Tax=Streptomyces sp. NPDC050121 TaxID=3365601 RepID=UPI00379B198D